MAESKYLLMVSVAGSVLLVRTTGDFDLPNRIGMSYVNSANSSNNGNASITRHLLLTHNTRYLSYDQLHLTASTVATPHFFLT